ncbi:tyrosine-type recombinase/integrase [Hyphococcus sp.]|uniref:tyrosine-type recombinase/integrase n=1 Tax=Hyphococcus sp. TaxID=2038636 RepID=UPI003CCB7FB9
MPVTKITKAKINDQKPGTRDEYVWDDEIRGFGLKITPVGKLVYLLQYRLGGRSGRMRRYTIGEHGKDGWTPATARRRAKELRDEINRGVDPMEMRDRRKETPTFGAAFEEYSAEQKRIGQMRRKGSAARKGWKPLTAKMNDRMARLFFLPRFKNRLVTDISRADISALHREMGETPRQANNVLQLLSGFFNWLEKTGAPRPERNPVSGIDRYEEHAIERFLTGEELQRLSAALSEYEERARQQNYPVQIAEAAAIRLAIFTGMRVGEILPLEWDWIDFNKSEIALPDSKVGKRTVPLNAPAKAVLSELERSKSPYVFNGQNANSHLPTMQRAWRKIRKSAKLEDVHLHDLRHTHASVGVTSGAHMRLIAGLLGHSTTRTTERYAHIDADPLRAASETIAKRIEDAMSA